MADEEIERLNEKFKINFFQIEKMLLEYDDRIRALEKRISERKGPEKASKQELEEEKQKLLELSKDIDNKYREKHGMSVAEMEKKFIELNKSKSDEYYKKINDFLKSHEKESEEMKNWTRGLIDEKISKLSKINSKVPEIEKQLEEFENHLEGWKIFKEDLEKDKDLYLELRKVVLASIEKVNGLERDIRKSLEDVGEVYTRLEESEKMQKELSDKTKLDLGRLEEDRRDIENKFEEFKANMKDKLTGRFDELDVTLEKEIKERLGLHGKKLNEIGDKVLAVEEKVNGLKKEVVEKTMDEEMNKLFVILNEKLKHLITIKEFEKIRAELGEKVERIRKPELRPLEDKISSMERDLEELKRLMRGISLRVPVIIE